MEFAGLPEELELGSEVLELALQQGGLTIGDVSVG